MNKLAVLFILVLTLLSACIPNRATFISPHFSRPEPTTVYIDRNFTPEQTKLILSGIQNLECSTDYYFRYLVFTDVDLRYRQPTETDRNLKIVSVLRTDPRIANSDHKMGPELITFALYVGYINMPEILMVSDRLRPDQYTQVSIHELLHALGISHGPDRSIMSETISGGSNTLTNSDFQLICKQYNCDPSTFHPCPLSNH